MSIAFRPDIEGIRALAILLVVGSHTDFPGLGAGFIGVDIFFVVSGYLISALLISEIDATGRIDLGTFYARRIRRLLPAFIFMLVCISFATWHLLPAFRQSETAFSASLASFWASNIQFALARADYFDQYSKVNAFLHTWSLGVEEQFYLIWPILISASIARRHRTATRLTMMLICVFSLSLTFNVWLTPQLQTSTFFLMPLRAWQFSAGALAYVASLQVAKNGTQETRKCGAQALSWTGVSLIFFGLLFISESHSYPGAWAIIPTAATALLLVGNSVNSNSAVVRVLSIAPAQWIGRISYSWYLWHWPFIVLGTAAISKNINSLPLALALASLLPAWLSFTLLEGPVRKSSAFLSRPKWTIIGALLISSITSISALKWYSHAEDARLTHDSVSISRPKIYAMGCDEWHKSSRLNPCHFGDDRKNGTILMIGDSVGLQWFPAIESIAKARDMRLVILTKSACPIVDEDYFYDVIGRSYAECKKWRESALRYASSISPTWLIIGSSAHYPFNENEWRHGSERIFRIASDSADIVMVLRPTPSVPFDGPSCALEASSPSAQLVGSSRCRTAASDARTNSVWTWVNEATTAFSNVRTVDMNPLICPNEKCQAVQGGLLVFRDSTHLDGNFASSLANVLGHALDEAAQSVRSGP